MSRERDAADYVSALTGDELRAFLASARDTIQSVDGERETIAKLSRGHSEGVTRSQELQRQTLALMHTDQSAEYLANCRRVQAQGVRLPTTARLAMGYAAGYENAAEGDAK